MDKEDLKFWLVAVSIVAAVCAFGWYSTSTSDTRSNIDSSAYSGTDENEFTIEEYKKQISEYKDALYEANDTISDSNSCVDEAFGLFDNGEYDDGLYQLDNCRYDEVSDPGSGI